MKEQLPLKRIFIGLVASVTAGVAVTAAGAVDNTVLVRPEKASVPYIVKSEAAEDNTYSAEASVVALNHEETNNSITKLTDLTTVSSSAFKAEAEEAVFVKLFKAVNKVFFQEENAVGRPEGNSFIIIIAFWRIFDYYRTVLGQWNFEVAFAVWEVAVSKYDFIAANINMRIAKII